MCLSVIHNCMTPNTTAKLELLFNKLKVVNTASKSDLSGTQSRTKLIIMIAIILITHCCAT